MEELEPWNMFTNDFGADENDTNGNREDTEENEKNEGNRNEGDDNDDNEDKDNDDDENLVPEVTMGGEDMENGMEKHREDEPGEDDDAIFNFGLVEEKVSPTRPRRRPNMSLVEEEARRKELESLINYDQAIVYICPACGSEYETQEEWKRHMNGVHAYNTRHGLNFVQIDKLYHECMQCYKRIAMHSMENLLKHKYTHLPYRCSKCKFCHRQYKYRQDLMVHLRTQHYAELIEVAKESKEALDKHQDNHQSSLGGLAIREIKENAVDIFENTSIDDSEPVAVRNEVLEQDDNDFDATAEHSRNSFVLPSFLEDALSRDSSRNSEQQSVGSGGGGGGGGGGGVGGITGNEEQSLYEKQIQYICPKCGQEYGNQNQWQQHIVGAHDFGTRRGLCFEEINSNQQARCMECEKIIPVNIIHHLQQHKFTHLPHKSWLRCKLCFEAFPSRPDILKHLMNKHRFGGHNESKNRTDIDDDAAAAADIDDSQDNWDCDDSLLTEAQRAPSKQIRHDERDKFDQHIEYLCPSCGNEFRIKKLWRKHLSNVHKLTSLEALNFISINEREVQCLECGKVITNAYGIQNAQQHYFTHMPFKSFIRCRLCSKSYTDRKGLMKHLRGKHLGRIRQLNEKNIKLHATSTPKLQHLRQPHHPLKSNQQNHLLTRALQRPLRNVIDETPLPQPPPKRQRPERYKEIVKRNDFVYEIEFIDEDDDDNVEQQCDNEVGIVNAAHEEGYNNNHNDDDDDILLVPEISNNNNNNTRDRFNGRERCPDCGSIFSTTEALRAHIRKEHDFYDQTRQENSKNINSNTTIDNSNNDNSIDDDDDLLMPVKSETIHTQTSTKGTSNSADCHFTYLCPACGVEHYTQMDWRRHINTVHNFDKRQYLNFRQLGQDRFQCMICNDTVKQSKLKTLQDHKFRHLPYKSYLKCKYCGTLYNHKPNMFGHLHVRHNIIAPRNSGNDEMTNDDYHHASLSHSSSSSTSTSMARMPQMQANIRPKANANNSNTSGFVKPPGLKTAEDVITFHNAVDHATITYFCPSCNENFDSHVFWRKHIVEEHNLNSREGLNFRQIDEHHYLCLQCYKRVTVTHTKGAIGQLQSHKFRHLPFKSFRCLRCNGEFVRKQMFFKHLNRATNRCECTIKVDTAPERAVAKTNVVTSTPSPKHHAAVAASTIAAVKQKASSFNTTFELQDDNDNDNDDGGGGTNASLIINQDAFVLVCPQCAAEFDNTRNWREHINVEHGLGTRDNLRFKRINPMVHKCLECGENVSGRKLRDLQVHRFKHLPYGPYIQCKFCKTGYSYISKMQEHLRQKHPNVVQKHDEYAKMDEMRLYEESSLADGDSLGGGGGAGGSSVVNEAEMYDDDDDVQVVSGVEIDDDEQYLLG